MGLGGFLTRWDGGTRRWAADLAVLPFLGVVAYFLFRASDSLKPGEAAILMMAAAGLVLLGRRWYAWQQALAPESLLSDWAARILQGDHARMAPPAGLDSETRQVVEALNVLLEENRRVGEQLASIHRAVAREWADLDGLLAEVQRQAMVDRAARTGAGERLAAYGRDLRETVEGSLRFDRIELEQRLRAGQYQLLGRTFWTAVEQAQGRLGEIETLLTELRDTFPRLQREEEALGRLADAGLRQGERLDLAVKGLSSHAPRLMEEVKARGEQLRRFRTSADGVRDQLEALGRRIEAFRVESQRRILAFGGAQGAIHVIGEAAQQTGLLAVNAAILAQQGGGAAGMQAIGGRLRGLADQTSRGTAELERALDEHQRGMERESSGLWDLQEVVQALGTDLQELLLAAGHVDRQSQDLERALEAHAGLVEQVRAASERAGRSLAEAGGCSMAFREALGRQWGVEAKAAVGVEELLRSGRRMADVGRELSRASRRTVEEIGEILDGHQKLRQSEAYRQIASGDLACLLGPEGAGEPVWNRAVWARAERRTRLLEAGGPLPPLGRRESAGGVRLLLLGQDALERPEASALAAWSCDPDAKTWRLDLIDGLRTEGHRHALQEVLRESALEACLPGTTVRVAETGVDLRLAFSYPGFPHFLAGLGLELAVDPAEWDAPFREAERRAVPVQPFLWCGPEMDPSLRVGLMRLVHTWVRNDPQHESFMLWLPYEGRRPPCPRLAEAEVEQGLEGRPKVRCVGLDADASGLRSLLDRLVEAGAEEGEGGAVLCAAGLGHAHPEALLLRLFQSGEGMADSPHPDLAAHRARFRAEVLGGDGDPHRAAWLILEDLQRKGWTLPLPQV